MSFSSATCTKPNDLFIAKTFLIPEGVKFGYLGTLIALFDFVFLNHFTVLKQFGCHGLRIDDLHEITHG